MAYGKPPNEFWQIYPEQLLVQLDKNQHSRRNPFMWGPPIFLSRFPCMFCHRPDKTSSGRGDVTAYRQVSNIRRTLINHWIVDHSDVVGASIACRRCSNYIFILHLTLGFNILCKDNCKPRWETFGVSYIREFTVIQDNKELPSCGHSTSQEICTQLML